MVVYSFAVRQFNITIFLIALQCAFITFRKICQKNRPSRVHCNDRSTIRTKYYKMITCNLLAQFFYGNIYTIV